MTAQTSWRRRSASVLATATAVLLAASGALLAPAAAFAEEAPAGPTLTVEPNVDLDRAGATVTVSGAGYDPNKPIYVTTCADVALAQLDFAYINKGCTAGAKQISLGATPSAAADAFQSDGTFSTTLSVSPKAGADATSVFTIANHRAPQDRSQDAKMVLEFAPEVVAPSAVSSVSAATATGLTVDTTLANVADVNGAYVAVIEAGTSGSLSKDNLGIATAWLRASAFVDGAAQNTLELAAELLDRTKSYEVIVWRGHTLPSAETMLSLEPLEVTTEQWDSVFPPVVAPTPKASSSITAADVKGLTLVTDLTHIPGPNGAYVAVIEAGTSGSLTAQNRGLVSTWVRPESFTDGAAQGTLAIPAAVLDRAKSYEVIVWKGHSVPGADTTLSLAPLSVSAAQWDSVFPPVVAPSSSVTARVSATKTGLTVDADIKNVFNSDGAYISVIEAGKIGDVTKDDMGIGADWVRDPGPPKRSLRT